MSLSTASQTCSAVNVRLDWSFAAGLVITDLYEDYVLDSPVHKYHASYIATRAMKL